MPGRVPRCPLGIQAEQARIAAGLTVEQAAKRAGISVGYLKTVERGRVPGGVPPILAERLCFVYEQAGHAACNTNLFYIIKDGSEGTPTSGMERRAPVAGEAAEPRGGFPLPPLPKARAK